MPSGCTGSSETANTISPLRRPGTRLGLSDEEMRQAVELLNEALEFDSHNEEARV